MPKMQKKKKYKIKKSPALIRKLVRFYRLLSVAEQSHYEYIGRLEQLMEKETGIKGIEFFYADGELAGIGNADRTMELIHRSELDGK